MFDARFLKKEAGETKVGSVGDGVVVINLIVNSINVYSMQQTNVLVCSTNVNGSI